MMSCLGNINLLILNNRERKGVWSELENLEKNADLNWIKKGMRHPHFTVISGS
jgi:hypothetical protein